MPTNEIITLPIFLWSM